MSKNAAIQILSQRCSHAFLEENVKENLCCKTILRASIMRFQPKVLLGVFLALGTYAYKPESTHATDELAANGLRNLEAHLRKQLWNGDRDL